MTVFIRVLAQPDKATSMRDAIASIRNGVEHSSIYDINIENFGSIPGSPFAYWISDNVRNLHVDLPSYDKGPGRDAKVGLQTSDDNRFVRAWWEVANVAESRRWISFARGEPIGSFYGDVSFVVGYSRADQVGLMKIGRYGRGADCYYKPGLIWTLRASSFQPRILPAGCIFSQRGQSCFASESELLSLLALMKTKAVDFIFKMSLGRFGYPEFLVGPFSRLPVPVRPWPRETEMEAAAHRAWSLKRQQDTINETSHAFHLPEAIIDRIGPFDRQAIESELSAIQSNIDSIAFEMYGFNELDRIAAANSLVVDISDDGFENEIAEDNQSIEGPEKVTKIDDLLSWAVGVVFGRFDWRLALGERLVPAEPSPFAPLPTRSPGMLPEGGEPFHRHSGFLVDDRGHQHDLGDLVEAVLTQVRVESPSNLRRWLQRDLFRYHLKRYSKSGRKAPIYWQLAIPSGRYSVWLYAHDVNNDTFFRLQHDVIEHKIDNEERELSNMTQDARELSNHQRQDIENQQSLVGELRQLADEVKRIAALWSPNLDDGIVLTMAPLWRIAGSNLGWQAELRAKWQGLQAGKYDWSHQAMHLWPERVVLECAEDRSLAIAHDLEDVFWFETGSGKWAKRDVPKRAISEIVRERTSDAVKAALKELLEAPEPAATGSRSRRKA